mmetsp:Transcript_77346/g.149375  ORF Transcript_77346/g.149375 Transcript_77346/m.149375 type:complete len:409 (-) Transcript_77346:24-1250(-)
MAGRNVPRAGLVAEAIALGLVKSASLSTESLMQRACRLMRYGGQTPVVTGRILVETCLANGLRSMSPGLLCSFMGAMVRQGFMHTRFFEASLERMHASAVARLPASALRAWVGALVELRVPVPARHMDACCCAIMRRSFVDDTSAAFAAPMLRSLLLAKVKPADTALRYGDAAVGHLLSTVSTKILGKTGTGSTGSATRTALADAAWLLEHRRPSWLRPLAAHHSVVMDAARDWPCVAETAESGTRQGAAVKEAVRAALVRLGVTPDEGHMAGHFHVPLALPQLQCALLCPGDFGELRDLACEEDVSSAGTGCSEARPSLLRPLLELRTAQLQQLGWHVEVIRDAEWHAARKACVDIGVADGSIDSSGNISLARGEELLLRLKLASSLQSRVPRRRRKSLKHLELCVA